jgi:anti-sigma-K factor RskA
MNLLQPERLDALAREYTLGTLHGGARRRFERLLREQPAAGHAVLAWQGRLATLAASVPLAEPSARVWAALEQRLFSPPAAPAPPARASGWLGALLSGRTLGGALAGSLAGALLAIGVLVQQPTWVGLERASESLPASYVGLLHDPAGRPTLLASSRRHGRTLTVKLLQPLAVPADRVALLWALPKDGGEPFLVGRLPASGSASLPLADRAERLFFGVSRLGVSLEPSAAAARPSGPFVLAGDCVKLW